MELSEEKDSMNERSDESEGEPVEEQEVSEESELGERWFGIGEGKSTRYEILSRRTYRMKSWIYFRIIDYHNDTPAMKISAQDSYLK